MKTTYDILPERFTPVAITITCESQEELDALGTLFNHAFISDAVERVFKVDVCDYRVFRNAGADIDTQVSALGNAIKAEFGG